MTGRAQPGTATLARLTPEVALVDAELGLAAAELRDIARQLRARAGVPDAGSGDHARPPAPMHRVRAAQTASRMPKRTRSRPTPTMRTRLATVSTCLVCAVAIAASALGAVPAAGTRTEATRNDVQSSASALRERASRDARASHIYTWSAVPGALRYEVRILRGEQSLFEATTRRLAVELPQDLRMPAGRYTWLVTPVFAGDSPSARPVVEATFLVAP